MTVASPLGPAIRAVEQASSAQELVRASRALAEALAAAGDGADQHGQAEAIGCLVQVLGFNNPGAAVAAVEGLIAVGSAAVLPLLDHLDPRNYGARAWAVRALAGIGDVRGLALLEEALATDVGPSVRRAAACGLGQLRLATLATAERQAIRARALAALLAGCSDGEWVVRYAVAVGLEKLMLAMEPLPSERDQARQALLALGQDQHQEVPVVRLRADLALRRLQQPDPVRSGRCA